ncbi:hypothetical protein FRC11_008261 [Ceratobasidium sp. 423]|nr:hypothetical protein FRC11_008261 [Ceratobasidium sp. 423]
MLPPTPLHVGGGWSQEVLGGSGTTAPSTSMKRRSDGSSTPDDSGKRQRMATAVPDDDTATEPETDDEPLDNTDASIRAFTKRVIACPSCTTNFDPRNRPPQRGTHAPPPSRGPTATTVLETQPSTASSHSLGGSIPPSSSRPASDPLSQGSVPPPPAEPDHPHIVYPTTGHIHDHLRDKLSGRFFASSVRQADAAETAEAGEPQPTDVDEVSETEFGLGSNTSQRATRGLSSNRYTYKGYRSHVPSEPEASFVEPTDTNNAAGASTRPNSPSITPSQLIRRERARAVAAKAKAELAGLAPRRRSRVFSSTSRPPASRSQPRPPLGSKGNSSGRRTGGPRRLDPTSAARADMLAFNRAVAQGEATSFAESVTRQSERTPRCEAPESRPRDELLDDDEEMLAHAEALANGKWPLRSSRVRKPKPSQRDVSGIERQVLIMAKIHLFAYALVEGIYQTRATFLLWASAVHEATWQMDLPDRPYKKPQAEIFEIMVNNIATLRGKAKERLREFVARVSGFQQNLRDKNAIQNNINRFNELYPNSFHCRSSNPREGDYEHPELAHCISLIIFYGPNSVGVLYSDYFREMPLPAVAFCLAMWQFCVEEWANGWRQNGDLGMGAMCEKYEAQLAGLKELRRVAPRRMHRLQNEWRDYAAGYSGAVFVPDEADDVPVHQPLMRPDTPELDDAISVEEMEARLLETARQESLREQTQALAARELEEVVCVDEDEESRAATPRSHSPSPLPVEHNEHGVVTARSKGQQYPPPALDIASAPEPAPTTKAASARRSIPAAPDPSPGFGTRLRPLRRRFVSGADSWPIQSAIQGPPPMPVSVLAHALAAD